MPWVVRVGWAGVPFAMGPAIGEALRHHGHALQIAASVGMWTVWAAVVVATLVPHPIGLTALRCAAPAAAAVSVWAALDGGPGRVAIGAATGWGLGIVVVSFLPAVGVLFVNGLAYPNERRFPLAPPAALLLGPIELTWAALVGLPTAALVLLSSSQWIAGALVTALAVPTTWVLGRALHGLSRRWAVFVPAGFVLHDPMSLIEPVLFVREVVESVGPAPARPTSLDLSRGAAGLAVELRLGHAVPVVVTDRRERTGRTIDTDRLLFTPTRAGVVLDEAARRRLPVGAPAA
ncbi:MAG: hypothetical protein ACYDH6_12870 [Acidimicrobiales bacterium]